MARLTENGPSFAEPSSAGRFVTRCCARALRRAREQPQRRACLGASPRSTSPRTAPARRDRDRRRRLPGVWGAGQLATGWLSDHTGRKPLIVLGMLVQAAGLVSARGKRRRLRASLSERRLSLVSARRSSIRRSSPPYPMPCSRGIVPPAVGVYRFWRDAGFALGGLLAGVVADAAGSRARRSRSSPPLLRRADCSSPRLHGARQQFRLVEMRGETHRQ